MMNKKLVGTALVGLMTVGFAGQVLAAENQNINGTTDAEVLVNGNLGYVNNEDEEEIIEEGDDKWINVTLPTATVFAASTDKKTIVSPSYEIFNNSGRPVNISVADYTIVEGGAGVDALQKLELISPNSDVKNLTLAENGNSVITEPVLIDNVLGSKKAAEFKFAGEVDESQLPTDKTKRAEIDSTLTFKFKAVEIVKN